MVANLATQHALHIVEFGQEVGLRLNTADHALRVLNPDEGVELAGRNIGFYTES